MGSDRDIGTQTRPKIMVLPESFPMLGIAVLRAGPNSSNPSSVGHKKNKVLQKKKKKEKKKKKTAVNVGINQQVLKAFQQNTVWAR